MNRLSQEERVRVIASLVEGNSIRSRVRMTGVAKNTVARLLVEIGAACLEFQNEIMQNLPCKRLQADEIWSFVGAKQKNVQPHHFEDDGFAGDVWTWTAIDADTKLVPVWAIGPRDAVTARDFMTDLASRLKNRVQLTTDGLKAYLSAVDAAFGDDIDFAQLIKVYGTSPDSEKRYSPAQCMGCEKNDVKGSPDRKYISTSFVERQNLTMRMSMRRFTRLTNAFSKKLENHIAAISLHFMFYNFARVHQTLKTTPAVAAGIADRVWTVADIVGLLEKRESN